MMEEALRKRLRPAVNRRRRLQLAWRLSIYWFVAALAAVGLISADWLWGWRSTTANWTLCVLGGLATAYALYRYCRTRVDYKAVARYIEQKHPDLKALLLTAIEQEPEQSDGQFGYLQERVIGEAVRHASRHDWLRSISSKRLVSAELGGLASLLLLAGALSQLLGAVPALFGGDRHWLAARGYQIAVSPGDTHVEAGSPVVILARFSASLPPEAYLLFGAPGETPQKMELTKNLDDPVFGGIIQQVNSDLLYCIEYAGRRTRDYRISVYERPALTRADARITYPSYTKLPEKVITDTRHISAVEGSQIALTFLLNKAVATAKLVPKTGAEPGVVGRGADVPLNVSRASRDTNSAIDLTVDGEHPNVYTTSLIARQSEWYELHLTDAQGLTNEIPQRFVIDVYKNLPAQIKPTFPNRDVLASPLEELSLEAKVSDDYGVTGYGLSYALTGGQSKDVPLGPPAEPNEKRQFKYMLALEGLGVQPAQLLTYYFWADDVGPDGKTRRTASDMYFAEIRPFEEVFRESQSSQDPRNQQQNQNGQQQNQQDQQLARLEKQIIIATWNVKRQMDQSGRVDDHKEDLDVVHQSQAEVLQKTRSALTQAQDPSQAKALQAATKHMETSLDHLAGAAEKAAPTELTPALAAEQSAYQELLKLRRGDQQVARGRSSSAGSTARSARSQQQLQQLELRQQENRYETQRFAQSQEQTTQHEDLQVLNRLRELARRQSEMSNRLKELDAALRQAQTEQQKEEIRRELKRLREEQVAALRDVDELQQRMESPQNRQRMADAREQLDQSRSRIRESLDELAQGMVSRAVTSTTRAQRQLEQMRDEFRKNTSSQFTDQMRDMRQQARQLDQRQKEIADQMKRQIDAEQKTLTDPGVSRELADRMDRQKQDTNDLIDQMKDVSEQAEASEPLLSRKLYDTLRQTSTGNVDKSLEAAGELLRRNFLPEAQQVERQAGKGIEELRKGVEEAAKSVLGDEAESMRVARQQLDELIKQVNEEAARARQSGRQGSEPNGTEGLQANQSRRADARSRAGGEQRGEPNRPGNATGQRQQANAQSGVGREQRGDGNRPRNSAGQRQQANAQSGAGRGQAGDPNRARDLTANQQRGANGRRAAGPERAGNRLAGGRTNPRGGGAYGGAFGPWEQFDPNGPLTGREFTRWSDRLRDVEEMLNEPDLRNEAAAVRDRARAMRAEFTRHGKEPQWDLVTQQITKPLTELRDRVSEELARLQPDNSTPVPIDRDPVPGRFAELVRRYYEKLGGED
jgi:hypothetical protein